MAAFVPIHSTVASEHRPPHTFSPRESYANGQRAPTKDRTWYASAHQGRRLDTRPVSLYKEDAVDGRDRIPKSAINNNRQQGLNSAPPFRRHTCPGPILALRRTFAQHEPSHHCSINKDTACEERRRIDRTFLSYGHRTCRRSSFLHLFVSRPRLASTQPRKISGQECLLMGER